MNATTFITHRMHFLRLADGVRSTSILDDVTSVGALQAQDYESGLRRHRG